MQNNQFRVSRNSAGVDYMLPPCETSFHKHRIRQFASSQIYWMTLHKLWILKSQIWAAIMRNMIDLLPAMIEINGSKTAYEDPNQRPEVEIYFHVVDNVIQWYFWILWRRIRSWVRIRSRLAVGNWNTVFAGRIFKIKAGWLFTSRLVQCRTRLSEWQAFEGDLRITKVLAQLYLTSAHCFVY